MSILLSYEVRALHSKMTILVFEYVPTVNNSLKAAIA